MPSFELQHRTLGVMDFSALSNVMLERPLLVTFGLLLIGVSWYLIALNVVFSRTPEAMFKLTPTRWSKEELKSAYKRLEKEPVTTESYASKLPQRLQRRYIVTGGSGLVGGHIVLQLLARGQPPDSIRIVDLQPPQRPDMLYKTKAVPFFKTNISSAASTEAAFSAPWPSTVAHLPLTVFHTAAVIVPSERSYLFYSFCEKVNVHGTRHVLESARRAGADVLISTTSGSIAIQPVQYWVSPWRLLFGGREGSFPRGYWQMLDERDFFRPLRDMDEFFALYPASKAIAERIVCEANSEGLRTGSIRPANGVYGNPTDNTVGGPLGRGVSPEWSLHVVQSFVHGANCAIAHLQLEAVLAKPSSHTAPQAGRPFAITDPNPPIMFGDLYGALKLLAVTPFSAPHMQPVPMLLLSYVIEAYSIARVRYPWLGKVLPEIKGDLKHLKPPLFSITTHLPASAADAMKSVQDGGIGYEGVITTQDGMVGEVVEWNREHRDKVAERRKWVTSVSLADEIQKMGEAAGKIKA